MQTVLKIVCGNRGLGKMVDEFIVRFCAKATGEIPMIDIPADSAEDVAFIKDDCCEAEPGHHAAAERSLGSFGPLPTESMQLVFVNPVIVSYRPTRHRLCVWIAGPTPGNAAKADSD